MHRTLWIIGLLFMMAACTPGAPATPTALPITGEVDITSPQTGAIIYSPVLYVTGTAANLPPEGFRLLIVSAEDETLHDAAVIPQDNAWVVEISNPVTETPVEVTISALTTDTTSNRDYDVVSVALSSESLRPAGVFGMIITPFDGDTTGGDAIPVYGTASGLFEGTLNISLEQPDGTIITDTFITVYNPGIVDEVPWDAEITTGGYQGEAVLRIYYVSAQDGEKVTLDDVMIILGDAAG